MQFLTPEEMIAKKKLKEKLLTGGIITIVGLLSGGLTYLFNMAL
ncbi:hypothetical protein [Neobacillus notoginsengisoli]|nr:hypothetical protein [Neobacillus notoginsengisoli]